MVEVKYQRGIQPRVLKGACDFARKTTTGAACRELTCVVVPCWQVTLRVAVKCVLSRGPPSGHVGGQRRRALHPGSRRVAGSVGRGERARRKEPLRSPTTRSMREPARRAFHFRLRCRSSFVSTRSSLEKPGSITSIVPSHAFSLWKRQMRSFTRHWPEGQERIDMFSN